MAISLRSQLIAAVAVITASAVIAAPSLVPRPATAVVVPLNVELTAAVVPLVSKPLSNITGATFPEPPTPVPTPVTTDFADAIKNTYSAIEPWVQYGFELATYAVGWVPYVGWLSGQIMIFYNFGERIVRSLVFNSADWLWGPLPLGDGLRNIARDSWNALVQLGIDEWNFFLPPLPPLPPHSPAAPRAIGSATKRTAAQQESGSVTVLRPHKASGSASSAKADTATDLKARSPGPRSAPGAARVQRSAASKTPHPPRGPAQKKAAKSSKSLQH